MSAYSDWATGGSSGGGSAYGSWQPPKANPTLPVVKSQPSLAHEAYDAIGAGLSAAAHGAANFIKNPVRDTVGAAKAGYNNVVKPIANSVGGAVSEVPAIGKQAYHTGAFLSDSISGNQLAAAKQHQAADKTFESTYFYQKFLKPEDAGAFQAGKDHNFGELGSAVRKSAGSATNEGLNLVSAGDIAGGLVKGVAKEGIKDVAEQGLKATVKQGVAAGAKYGTIQGAGNALQADKFNPKQAAATTAESGAVGAITGGGLAAAGYGLTNAINKFMHVTRGGALEAPVEDKQLALPAGPEQKQLPAGASQGKLTSPNLSGSLPGRSNQTAGPNGGVFGNFQKISPETQTQLSALEKTIELYRQGGEHPDALQHLSQVQLLRNQAAKTMDALASDRAEALKSQHDQYGGTTTVKNADGQVTGRMSSNDPFYAKTYKETGKPPTPTDILNEAHRQLAGGTDAEAKHYQTAAGIADQANKVYADKIAKFKTSDIYAPEVNKEQAAAQTKLPEVQAKAGQERLNGGTSEAPKPPKSADDVLGQINKSNDAGKNSPAERIKLINNAIEHPDVPSQIKEQLIAERDALLPSRKSEPAVAETPLPIRHFQQAGATAYDYHAPAEDKMAAAQAAGETLAKPTVAPPKAETKKVTAANLTKPKQSLGARIQTGALNPMNKLSANHADAANYIKDWFGQLNIMNRRGVEANTEVTNLAGGDKNANLVHSVVEGGQASSPEVAKAAEAFSGHAAKLGQAAVENGVIGKQSDNYFARILKKDGSMPEHGSTLNTQGLSKSTKFAMSRLLNEDGTPKYKTLDEAQAAVGNKGVFETHAGKVIEALYKNEGKAVVNAQRFADASNVKMGDGRPMVFKATDSTPKPPGDYTMVQGHWVHPDAAPVLTQMVAHGGSNDPLLKLGEKALQANKRVTIGLNPIPHMLHVAENNVQLHPFTPLINMVTSTLGGAKIFDKNPELVDKMVLAGANFFRYKNDLIDGLTTTDSKNPLTKYIADPISNKLFKGMIDNVMADNIKTIYEKGVGKGLSDKEAMQVAVQHANITSGSLEHFTSSKGLESVGRVGMLAYDWTASNIKEASRAVGWNIDRSLSPEAQKFQMRTMQKSLAMGFASTFAVANAINLASLGRPTWQNASGHQLDPGIKDPKTGKVTYLSVYGGIGDLIHFATNPVGEAFNKVNPVIKEVAQVGGNRDFFTGQQIAKPTDSGGQKAIDTLKHIITTTMFPAGVSDVGSTSKTTAAKVGGFLGVGGSSSTSPINAEVASLVTEQNSVQSQISKQIATNNPDKAQQIADEFNQKITAVGNSLATNPDISPAAKQKLLGLGDLINVQTYPKGTTPPAPKDTTVSFVNAVTNPNVNPQQVEKGMAQFKDDTGQKLLFMQTQRAAGKMNNSAFFDQNPNLDPNSAQFGGYNTGNNKDIKAGMAAVKAAGGSSLSYMQAVKQSGSTYFDKFFQSNPQLDPTSSNFQGYKTGASSRAKSEAKYVARGAKYAAAKAKSRGSGKMPKAAKAVKPTKISIKGLTRRKVAK